MDPAAGNSGSPAIAERDDFGSQFQRYGIDARARSALRAFARFHGKAMSQPTWAASLFERVSPLRTADSQQEQGLRRLVELFAQLPARDFDAGWLDELLGVWSHLLACGCSADLPMQIAYRLTALCVEVLERGRDSYSRLDAEIALAIGAAGLLVCGVLAQAGRGPSPAGATEARHDGADIIETGTSGLRGLLSAALELDETGMTGVLTGQVEAASTMLAVEDDVWARLYARSLTRLRPALRDKDILCRTGRSRFAVILQGLRSSAQVLLAADRIMRLFDAPMPAAGREYRLVARIGGAWAPDHGRDASELLRCANLALHEADRLGRSVAMFEPALLRKAERDVRIEDDFLRALDQGGLTLHYQPQVDLVTGRCTGAEALLRWPESRSGPVPPPLTVEIAERLGVAPQLTRWILHQSCRSLAEFARLGIDIELSVNLTAGDLADPELPLVVRNVTQLWHVAPNLLKFELTESAMLSNESVSSHVMASLRELGAATSIDDFGTGYSSVILLKKLPLSELKLDGSFVASAVHSERDRKIVRSLIQLAHSLQLEVVGEGVENEATLALLREYGCDRAQGFFISKPLADEQFVEWWRARLPTLRRQA